MTVSIPTLAEINRRASDVLIRELGVIDALRFLNHLSAGRDDSAGERETSSAGISLEDIVAAFRVQSLQPPVSEQPAETPSFPRRQESSSGGGAEEQPTGFPPARE